MVAVGLAVAFGVPAAFGVPVGRGVGGVAALAVATLVLERDAVAEGSAFVGAFELGVGLADGAAADVDAAAEREAVCVLLPLVGVAEVGMSWPAISTTKTTAIAPSPSPTTTVR